MSDIQAQAQPDAQRPSILVVSAHAADFVWRAGGAIALYAERGYNVKIAWVAGMTHGRPPGVSRFVMPPCDPGA